MACLLIIAVLCAALIACVTVLSVIGVTYLALNERAAMDVADAVHEVLTVCLRPQRRVQIPPIPQAYNVELIDAKPCQQAS